MAGMSVTARRAAGRPSGVATFGAQLPNRTTQGLEIATVPVDENQPISPAGGRPPVLEQQHPQSLGADRDRSGKTLMLTAGTVCDRGRQQPTGLTLRQAAVHARGNRPGDRGRDPGVGIQRQVRSVLFS